MKNISSKEKNNTHTTTAGIEHHSKTVNICDKLAQENTPETSLGFLSILYWMPSIHLPYCYHSSQWQDWPGPMLHYKGVTFTPNHEDHKPTLLRGDRMLLCTVRCDVKRKYSIPKWSHGWSTVQYVIIFMKVLVV